RGAGDLPETLPHYMTPRILETAPLRFDLDNVLMWSLPMYVRKMVDEYRIRFTEKERAWWDWYLGYLDQQQAAMCPTCRELTSTYQSFVPRPSQSNEKAVREKKDRAVGLIFFCQRRLEREPPQASSGLHP